MARMVMMVFCVVVTCMVVAETYAQAITCDQVVSDLSPCYGYLTNGGAVSSACCSGVDALNSAANSASARQTAFFTHPTPASISLTLPAFPATVVSTFLIRSVQAQTVPRWSDAKILMHV
uniref:Bifunctional inhibitor/plant lipid transfer protein/seed storage helical domain-containing protein n=1 Tax=Lactuca sativa TaxID=4236 RepID=A0A9R1WN72_LACSA|nr:hypothetical protein LSAT_V11C100028670 [Lactuca sativa]